MRGAPEAERVRRDFDRIAGLVEGDAWDHNRHYHPFLLRQLPEWMDEALEIGCGTGDFSRALASRARRVVALDLSARMVEVARRRSTGQPNVEYVVADADSWTFPDERYDCVASVATVHHLPLARTLARMRDALKPGGTLILLDLCGAEGIADLAVGAAAFPVAFALRLAVTGRLTEQRSPALRRAWEEHGRTDTYPTLKEMRDTCAAELPGAQVRRHILWRLSVVWRKPGRSW